jgi:hypothetical protein
MNDISKAVISVEGYGITTFVLTETTDGDLAYGAGAEANTAANNKVPAGTLDVNGAAITANLKDNAIYTPDYANYGPLYTLKDAGYAPKLIIRASTKLAASPTTHWDHIDLTRNSKDWMKDNEFNLFAADNSAGYWAYLESYTNPNEIAVSNVVYRPSFAHQFNPITDTTTNVINGGQITMEITGLDEATSNVKVITGGQEIQLVKTGDYYSALLTEYETTGLSADTGSPIAVAVRAANGIGEVYTDSAVTTIDYDKPAKPVVRFTSGNSVSFTNSSDDVVNYYLYQNYIPDNGASPIKSQLSAADAVDYNMCYGDYADTNDFKVIAIDGQGIFGQGNISNAKSFTFVNILKGTNVITNNFGESATAVVYYNNSDCALSADTANKKGVELQALVEGTLRMAYVPMTGEVDNTADIPTTAFYSVDGTEVIKVTALESYKSDTFYIEYNGAMYSGTFLTRVAADATFTTPVALTAVISKNQTLSPTVIAPSEDDLAEEEADADAEAPAE